MILESGIVSGTNTDLLSGGRLNAIPYAGQLTLLFQSDLADATNNYALVVQKPNGDVPVDGQLIPGTTPVDIGILDERQYLMLSFQATVGGHFQITLTETGTAVCTWRAVLRP